MLSLQKFLRGAAKSQRGALGHLPELRERYLAPPSIRTPLSAQREWLVRNRLQTQRKTERETRGLQQRGNNLRKQT